MLRLVVDMLNKAGWYSGVVFVGWGATEIDNFALCIIIQPGMNRELEICIFT
jgi:hypothetical protein